MKEPQKPSKHIDKHHNSAHNRSIHHPNNQSHNKHHPSLKHIKEKEQFYRSIIIIVILVLIITYLLYFIKINNIDVAFLNKLNHSKNNSNIIQQDIPVDKINSSEYHWPTMPVTFNFSNINDCGGFQTRRIYRAFDEIQNATSGKVTFSENNLTADIVIICNRKFNSPENPGLIQSGEASVSIQGNIILHADIYFFNTGGDYYNGGCRNYPDVEIHEILHAFGFQHTDKEYNIMNPIGSYCPTHINDDIVEKLLSIYG